MGIVFIEGQTLVLRPLVVADLNERYQQWLNDDEVCRYNSHATFPYTAEKMQAYFQSLHTNANTQIVLAMIHKDSGAHVGNISLQAINWVSRNAEFAILLGDKNFWGTGAATEASLLICRYGFERLNLHRIYCGTSSENRGMQKLATRMGMQQEGIRRQAMFKNGQYVDVLEYGVLSHEFESIPSK